MQVQKFRVQPDANGLVPAGHYFQRVSGALRDSNARDAARREQLDAEDRDLEARYRRASASRSRQLEHGAAL